MIHDDRFNVAKNGHLHLKGIDLVELASKYDTPLFIFDSQSLRENFKRFDQAFSHIYSKAIVCYSIKTNKNLTLCKILCQEGAYADVASGLDFHVARKAGFPNERIIVDGLYKNEELLRDVLDAGVPLINVESFSELDRINRLASKMGVKQVIGIRVNPFKPRLLGFSYEDMLCNPSSRFGFSINDAYAAFKRTRKLGNVDAKGIMIHPHNNAIDILIPIMQKIHDELGIEIEFMNVGGGFDSGTTSYISTKDLAKDLLKEKLGLSSKLVGRINKINIETTASKMITKLKQSLKNMPEPTVILEPGRYIVGNAGFLLLRVDHVKQAGGYKWIVVNGGTNLVPHFKEQREIRIANRADTSPMELINIVGPILFPDDFIAIKRRLPKIREGDILAVYDCGAYTLSKSTQFLHPRPSAVMLDGGGKVVEIRARETFEDITRLDRLV